MLTPEGVDLSIIGTNETIVGGDMNLGEIIDEMIVISHENQLQITNLEVEVITNLQQLQQQDDDDDDFPQIIVSNDLEDQLERPVLQKPFYISQRKLISTYSHDIDFSILTKGFILPRFRLKFG